MFKDFLNLILEGTSQYFRYCKAINELHRLSDYELKDIGINRCEIPYVVYDAMIKL